MIVGGIGSLALADRTSRPLIVAGLLATILGTLLLGPLAIRSFARAAGHLPVAPRLALRDLGRYQARSGAALAAITLALGITAAVVVIAAAEEKQEDERMAAQPPNLSDRQIRIYTGRTQDPQLIPLPIQSPAQLARSAARVRQLAAGLGQAVVIPLWKPVQPGEPPLATFEGDRALVAVGLARRMGRKSFKLASGLYVATPPLLRHLGIDPATVDPTADFLADPTVPTEELVILRFRDRKERAVTNVQRIDSREVLGAGDESSDLPSSFVTLAGLRRYGWQRVASGWLVESSRPLTGEQIAAARDLAAEAGLTIEVQQKNTSLARPIAIATAAGALLALVILAMTVGLIRSESARRPPHPDRHRSHEPDTAHADGRHRRRTRPPRRASRSRRRLPRARRDIPRRPRLSQSDPGAPPRPHRRRRPADGHRRRLASRRPRAVRHRPARHRVTCRLIAAVTSCRGSASASWSAGCAPASSARSLASSAGTRSGAETA